MPKSRKTRITRQPARPFAPSRRSYDAAMKRYLRGEAYRTVALVGGGAREVARRAKQQAKQAAARRLERVAAFHTVQPVTSPCCEEKVGKTHTAALAAY
jgi:hypothetical protein